MDDHATLWLNFGLNVFGRVVDLMLVFLVARIWGVMKGIRENQITIRALLGEQRAGIDVPRERERGE